MTRVSNAFLERLEVAFDTHRDPVRAEAMSAYLRHQFPFFGIAKPERVPLIHDAARDLAHVKESDVRAAALSCWRKPEREFHYAGVWFVRRNEKTLSPQFITTAKRLITANSWWDTVDEIASHVVGDLVRSFPALRETMDAWSRSPNIWLARSAILHQLRYRSETDADRLFRYCVGRTGDTDFFIRKAIGWALREYSKTDPEAVLAFVDANAGVLAGFSAREATSRLRVRARGRMRQSGNAIGADRAESNSGEP